MTGVVYTSDKLFTGNDDTGNNLSRVTTTPAMKQLAYISKWTSRKKIIILV
jgi:hypothetical protein